MSYDPQPILEKMSDDYESLLESGQGSDVVLVTADGKSLRAHKLILSTRSPVFAAMLGHDSTFKEAKENRVDITDMDFDVLQLLIKYIYTGKIEFLFNAESLLVAAEMYQLDHLKLACEQHLLREIDTDSVSDLLIFADMHSATRLTTACLEYITDNRTQVMASEGWKMILKEPGLMDQLFKRVSEECSNAKKRQKVAESSLSKQRFGERRVIKYGDDSSDSDWGPQ